MDDGPSVAEELREAVRITHDAIEKSFLARQISSAEITATQYIWLQTQLHAAHRCLEKNWQKHPNLATFYDLKAYSRLRAIEIDLQAFDHAELRPISLPVRELQSRIDEWSCGNGMALLGPVYILEGSRMGSRLLADKLGKALNRPGGAGVGYHASTPDSWMDDWRTFKRSLEQFYGSDVKDEIISASQTTFELLLQVYEGAELRSSDSD